MVRLIVQTANDVVRKLWTFVLIRAHVDRFSGINTIGIIPFRQTDALLDTLLDAIVARGTTLMHSLTKDLTEAVDVRPRWVVPKAAVVAATRGEQAQPEGQDEAFAVHEVYRSPL